MEYEVIEETIAEITKLQKSIDALRDLLAIQCSDGNWNYDPYMHGMANGMILAMSLFDGDRPNYLSPPEQWKMERSHDQKVREISLSK